MIRSQLLFVTAVLILTGCGNGSIKVYAPPELAGGDVLIDGQRHAKFSKATKHYRWVGFKRLKEEFSLPPRSETFATLRDVPIGQHEIRIEKKGYQPITRRLDYAGDRIDIEISDGELRQVDSSPAGGS